MEQEGKPLELPAFDATPPPAPVWPSAGSATVTLPSQPSVAEKRAAAAAGDAATPGQVQAGKLPVWIGWGDGATPASLGVEVLDRSAVPDTWQDGLVVRVTPVSARATGRVTAAGSARISIGYDSFRYAHGGDWASRLKLWELPDCALTTPDEEGCQATALPSSNDTESGLVTAEVAMSAGAGTGAGRVAAAGGRTVALSAGASGSDGSYAATPLAQSSTWSAGGSTGEFSWTYPMRVPPSMSGLVPTIGLAYSSATVDGRSEATNNQPSWIGEGFDYSPGFIERKYIGCAEDMEDNATNKKKTGDQCWRSDNAMLSLNGRATELIWDKGDKVWRGRSEDGSIVDKLTGASNGDDDGEHWRVTTVDGTQFFFGLNKLPGQTAATDSAWTSRVYGNHKDEPCANDDFAKAHCDQAWRWNLDYVVDVRGNTMSFWYGKEENRYAANLKRKDLVPYVRGGTLQRIDYGTWDRNKKDHGRSTRSVTARGQVVFDVADRCKKDCTEHKAASWPDVPWDQECKPTAKKCDNYSPSYWSTKRLATVTTRVWDTSVSPERWQDVDRWTLEHDFPSPGDGTHAGLWLSSVQQKGLVGGEESLPPVTFGATPLANRVLGAHNRTDSWQRLGKIITETGAKTIITYSDPQCTDENTAKLKPEENDKLCYPVIAPNPSDPEKGDVTQWWHKYRVQQVAQVDTALSGGHQAPVRNTFYRYIGDPAWHYSDDDGFIEKKRKTWSGFRGYATVETRVGDTKGAQTLTVTKYLRGMHDDRLRPDGGRRPVVVTATLGDETVHDHDQYAGMVREQTVYNGSTDKPVSKTVNVPWRSEPRASRTINGDVAEARFVNTRTTYSGTALGDHGSRGWRVTKSHSDFNGDGTVKWKQEDGDVDKNGDEQCVSYSYNNNAAKNLIGVAQQVITKALPCSKPIETEADVMSDARYTYDNASKYTEEPKYGNVTLTERLSAWTAAGGTEYIESAKSTYDEFGRVTSATDIRQNTTTTSYQPADRPVNVMTTVTKAPYNWKTVVTHAPAWGTALRTTDLGGGTSEIELDALGRNKKVWLAGWPKKHIVTGKPNPPSMAYEYKYSDKRTGYPYGVTSTLNAAGKYDVSYTIYDGWLRPRQSQTRATDGNRVVTDTLYDERGNATTTYPAHVEAGAASGKLLWVPEWSLRRVERTHFDNANRIDDQATLTGDGETNLVVRWRTRTLHEGDRTMVTPPTGAVPTTTVVDAQGRTRELWVHHTPDGVKGAYDVTKYQYNRKNQLAETVDPGGNKWTTTYDLLGRAIVQTDPDKGTTRLGYNDFGDLISTRDARGEAILTKYDDLGRKRYLYKTSETDANRIAEWKYDVLPDSSEAPGQLTESIRYDGGQVYKRQVTALNARKQPTAVEYDIPHAETGLGGSYLFTYEYSSFDGSPESVSYPEAGGLPNEDVTTTFDPDTGLPLTLETNLPGVTSYVTKQEYSKLGEPLVTFRKTDGGEYVQSTTEYDTFTRRVRRTTVTPETAAGPVMDARYSYDAAGNVLSITDTPAVGAAEKQCFKYDGRRRLVSAWTPATAAKCSVAPSVEALAGPAPYWTDWTIDALGNRIKQVSHAEAGDTTHTYEVPKPGEGVVRPHAVTSVTTKTPDNKEVTVGYTYDAAGNTKTRPHGSGNQQTLTWDALGKLVKTVDESGKKSTNLFDADGTRLIKRDSTGTTLYLPGMEVRRAVGGAANTATRYYQFAGATVASRTATSGLDWVFSDHQGTQQVTVNAATQKATVRRQTPFGGTRGTEKAWPNAKGFVGGDIDATGLIHIGAREYDAELGRFISVDPLLNMADPQQWNGYSYANNAPTTFSDPTGTNPICGNGVFGPRECPAPAGSSAGSTCGNGVFGPTTCGGGGGGANNGSSGPTDNPDDWTGRDNRGRKIPAPGQMTLLYGAIGTGNTYHRNWSYAGKLPSAMLPQELMQLMEDVACYNHPFECSIDQGKDRKRATKQLEDLVGITDAKSCVGSGVALGTRAAGCAWTAANFLPFILKGVGKAGMLMRAGKAGNIGDLPKSMQVAIKGGDFCSFSGDTRVLMANGSTKKISKIKVGDRVAAADPLTGKGGSFRVTALWVHDDKLVALTAPGIFLATTADHPFWNASAKKWQRADTLAASGGRLLTFRGREIPVRAGALKPIRTGRAFNFTVAHLHTYYVMAGNTPVLVHNCGQDVPVPSMAGNALGPSRPAGTGDDWVARTADNGKGQVWQAPGATGNANMVRVMNATDRYPNGYVRFHNKYGQPIGLSGKPGSRAETHIPMNPDGTYPLPMGW